MNLSKRAVVLLGTGCIFFFAFLNRINLIQKSEVVTAYAQRLLDDDDYQYVLSYNYNKKLYREEIENNINLKNETIYLLLIRKGNPADFLVFNFMGFWFVALVVAGVVSSLWLIVAHTFFEKVSHFKFLIGKEKKDELEEE